MSFDLYFAGSQAEICDDLILKNNGCRLFSQLNDDSGIKKYVDRIKNGTTKTKLFIDSGAFTASTQGIKVDIKKYVDKINNIGENINCFANLDVIPNLESINSIKLGCEQGWNNFMYIQNNCIYASKCAFVIHKNDPQTILWRAITYYKEHPELTYIALGGFVSTSVNSYDFCASTCSILKKELPTVKIHLFGYTKLKQLKYIHCDSTDSTTWIMSGANGCIMTTFGMINISDRQKYMKDSLHTQNSVVRDKIEEYVNSFGFNIKDLSQDYKQRMLFNLVYLMDWSKNYKYEQSSTFRKKLM